jgi:hypothetical protein
VVCDWAWTGNAKRPSSSSSSNRDDKVIPSGGNKEQQHEDESVGASHSCTSDEESEDYDTIDDHVLTDLEEEEEFTHKRIEKSAAEESFSHQLNKSNEDKWELLLTNENAASYHDHEGNNDTISIQDIIPISMETTKQTNIVQEEEETETEESCADSSYCSTKIRLNTATMEGEIPTSFLFPTATSSSSSHCLDPKFSTTESSTHSFAMEHRLFLRGIMELLKERDLVGVPANVDDPMYIKAGFLKEKQSTDVFWKLKYVELRKGILTFYTPSDPSLKRRKFIPLRASLCVTCRAVKSAPPSVAKYTSRGGSRTTSTFVFELSVQGHPRLVYHLSSVFLFFNSYI